MRGLCLCYIHPRQRSRGLGFMRIEPGLSRKTRTRCELGRDIWDAFLSLLFDSSQACRVSAVCHVTNGLCWIFNVNREDCWTLLESKYLTRFPSLGLPSPFPPSLLGLWQSSMKIFSLSRHMCQHQRPTTAWNSRGQFIEGDVGHCVFFPFLSLPWPDPQLV